MLTLTLLTLLALFCTYLEVYNQLYVEEIGSVLIYTLQSYRSYWLDLTFELLGELTGAMFLAASGAIYLCGHKEIGFLGSYAGFLGAALSGTSKMLILHPRPFLKTDSISNFTCPSDWGSPSGHASSAGAAMIVLSYFWLRQKTQTMAKVLFFLICTVIIGFDRVYLGVHYPFQVVLGYSYAAVVGCYFIQEKVVKRFYSLRETYWVLISEHVKIGAFCLVNTFIYNTQVVDVDERWKENYLVKCGKEFTVEQAMAKNFNESLYTLIISGFLMGFFMSKPEKRCFNSLASFMLGSVVCVVLIVYCLCIDKLSLRFLPYGVRFLVLAVNRYFSGFLIAFVAPKVITKLNGGINKSKLF